MKKLLPRVHMIKDTSLQYEWEDYGFLPAICSSWLDFRIAIISNSNIFIKEDGNRTFGGKDKEYHKKCTNAKESCLSFLCDTVFKVDCKYNKHHIITVYYY